MFTCFIEALFVGTDTNKGAKKKPAVAPKPTTPVKLKNIIDQEFTPARLQNLRYGKNCSNFVCVLKVDTFRLSIISLSYRVKYLI